MLIDDILGVADPALPVPQRVRDNILAVYGRLAAAESEAHGRPVDQIHFHEVGTLDALADVLCVCALMDALQPQRVFFVWSVPAAREHSERVIERRDDGAEIFARRLFRARQIDDKAAAARTGDGA